MLCLLQHYRPRWYLINFFAFQIDVNFGCRKKKAGVKLSRLIAWEVEVVEKVTKVNWECRVVLRWTELVDADPDPVAKKRSRNHRYRKCRNDGFRRRTRKRSWMTDHCFWILFLICLFVEFVVLSLVFHRQFPQSQNPLCTKLPISYFYLYHSHYTIVLGIYIFHDSKWPW